MRGHLAQVRDDSEHSLSEDGAGSAPTMEAVKRRPDVESRSE
jgi:hypothetical protein